MKALAISARDIALNPSTRTRTTRVRHIVMFSFKPGAPVEDLVKAFDRLVVNLEELVLEYERGTQCSPEGLEKGTTHCFMLTFSSLEARDAYLPHPLHTAFVEQWAKPWVDQVVVSDYEAERLQRLL